MIVRMSKLEIAGPKELLLDVLAFLRELGLFQPEPDDHGFMSEEQRTGLRSMALDERTATERLFLENLRRLTSGIIDLLPHLETRDRLLNPLFVLDSVAAVAGKHLAFCRDLVARREALRREREELERHALLLGTIGPLIGGSESRSGLEFIGVILRDQSIVDRLRGVLDSLTNGEFSLTVIEAADGTLIGLIATPASRGERLKEALSEEQLPELPFPASLRELPLPQRIARVGERMAATEGDMAEIDGELGRFARRWLAVYRQLDGWVAARLVLLRASAAVRETGMCFVIHGWARADEVAGLAGGLAGRFGGRVALEEQLILEQDLELVPVALRNPPFLRPFEIFTRLLPLPRYSSWDPTPFIGIFFPILVGMMLGDAGHGLVLMAAALAALRRWPSGVKGDAVRILLVSSSYAVIFGILFGEFFGDAGARLLHLEPLVLERSRAILPMLVFSVALGAAHVVLGLALGLVSALQRHDYREAAGRTATIGLIVCLAALAAPLVVPSLWFFTRPVLILAGLMVPFLFLSGGLLAPLELLKNIGNIISYARIMAIGLSSVLLANAANHLAGLTGDLVLGLIAGVMLHAVAIVLGVFAPAIHALRLHFVEFFGKFVEQGGRGFEPLR